MSRFKGVCWNKLARKWQASITVNRKVRHLGLCEDEADAALMYDVAAQVLFGSFARTNCPHSAAPGIPCICTE